MTGFVRVFLAGLLGVALASSAAAETITLNFNATANEAGDYIWFNSIIKLKNATSTSLYFTNSHITFTANGTNYNLTGPNATITFASSGTESASTTFNTATNTWQTSIAGSDALLKTNTFLSGLSFLTPSTGFGNLDITWTADFSASTAVSLNWQAAAAFYQPFTTDYNALQVKPTDSNTASAYKNSDHAGTPEAYTDLKTSALQGGGTGGTGSNWTGSYSPTIYVQAEAGPAPGPSETPLPAAALGGLVLFGALASGRGRTSARA